ncbi:MAG TPA: hypothetical protein VFP53_01715 [Sphingomicrobium sp.]|nr:hypothetical protein [Sphingomicrobium sp.]
MFAESALPPVEREGLPERAILSARSGERKEMEHRQVTDVKDKRKRPPPVTEQRNPEPGLEEELRKHPQDKDAKVDVGSDESMDASDPPSVVRPDSDEPVPSSGFDEDHESKT